jgi:hypothetical protein
MLCGSSRIWRRTRRAKALSPWLNNKAQLPTWPSGVCPECPVPPWLTRLQACSYLLTRLHPSVPKRDVWCRYFALLFAQLSTGLRYQMFLVFFFVTRMDEARQPLSRKIPLPSSQINPRKILLPSVHPVWQEQDSQIRSTATSSAWLWLSQGRRRRHHRCCGRPCTREGPSPSPSTGRAPRAAPRRRWGPPCRPRHTGWWRGTRGGPRPGAHAWQRLRPPLPRVRRHGRRRWWTWGEIQRGGKGWEEHDAEGEDWQPQTARKERMGRIAARREPRPWMEGRRGSVTAMDGRGRRHGRGSRGEARFAGTAAMDAAAMDGKNHGIKSCLRDLGSNFPCAGAAAAIGGGGCGRGEEEADGSRGCGMRAWGGCGRMWGG